MPKCSKKEGNNKIPQIEESCGNVFKDIGFSDAEAASLFARTELMVQVRRILQEKHCSQREAAQLLGTTQPRIADIMALNTKHFSVDRLLKYLAKLGHRVKFILEIDAA
ncbi:XRE family transcriptional regulator [bacterium]|nr:XRE family transcriptional regulator [bacterium]